MSHSQPAIPSGCSRVSQRHLGDRSSLGVGLAFRATRWQRRAPALAGNSKLATAGAIVGAGVTRTASPNAELVSLGILHHCVVVGFVFIGSHVNAAKATEPFCLRVHEASPLGDGKARRHANVQMDTVLDDLP